MTDIVEDLREYTRKIMVTGDPPRNYLPWRAADEIERLTAIAENAEALRRNLEDVSCCQQNEIERLKAENAMRTDEMLKVEALRADNEQLRAALEETVVAIVHVQKHLIHGSPPQDAVMNGALAIARAALEPKP
jgi:hypothetical protein